MPFETTPVTAWCRIYTRISIAVSYTHLSIIQMPPGIPVATVAINGAMNAAILAIQMLALSDEKLAETFAAYKEGLKKKIVKANEELKEVKFEYKTN